MAASSATRSCRKAGRPDTLGLGLRASPPSLRLEIVFRHPYEVKPASRCVELGHQPVGDHEIVALDELLHNDDGAHLALRHTLELRRCAVRLNGADPLPDGESHFIRSPQAFALAGVMGRTVGPVPGDVTRHTVLAD